MDDTSFTFLTSIVPGPRKNSKIKLRTDWKLGKGHKYSSRFSNTNRRFGKENKNPDACKSRRIINCVVNDDGIKDDNFRTMLMNSDESGSEEIVQKLNKLQISQASFNFSIKSCSDSLHFSSEKSDSNNLQNNKDTQETQSSDEPSSTNQLNDALLSKITLRKHQKETIVVDIDKQKNLSYDLSVKTKYKSSSATVDTNSSDDEEKRDLQILSADYNKVVCSTPDHIIPNFSLSLSIEDSKHDNNSNSKISVPKPIITNTSSSKTKNSFSRPDEINNITQFYDSYEHSDLAVANNMGESYARTLDISNRTDDCETDRHFNVESKWTDCNAENESGSEYNMSKKNFKTQKIKDSFIVNDSSYEEPDILLYHNLITEDIKNDVRSVQKAKKLRTRRKLRGLEDEQFFTPGVRRHLFTATDNTNYTQQTSTKKQSKFKLLDDSDLSGDESDYSLSSDENQIMSGKKGQPSTQKPFTLLTKSDISSSFDSSVISSNASKTDESNNVTPKKNKSLSSYDLPTKNKLAKSEQEKHRKIILPSASTDITNKLDGINKQPEFSVDDLTTKTSSALCADSRKKRDTLKKTSDTSLSSDENQIMSGKKGQPSTQKPFTLLTKSDISSSFDSSVISSNASKTDESNNVAPKINKSLSLYDLPTKNKLVKSEQEKHRKIILPSASTDITNKLDGMNKQPEISVDDLKTKTSSALCVDSRKKRDTLKKTSDTEKYDPEIRTSVLPATLNSLSSYTDNRKKPPAATLNNLDSVKNAIDKTQSLLPLPVVKLPIPTMSNVLKKNRRITKNDVSDNPAVLIKPSDAITSTTTSVLTIPDSSEPDKDELAANVKYKLPKSHNGVKVIPIIPNDVVQNTNLTTGVKCCSFLKSLDDGDLPRLPHPNAVRYRTQYKKYKDELASKLFSLYNTEIFDNLLLPNVSIHWNRRLTSSGGICRCVRLYNKIDGKMVITRTSMIHLSFKSTKHANNYNLLLPLSTPDLHFCKEGTVQICCALGKNFNLLTSAARLRETLIHEMCHAAAWVIDGKGSGHGPGWRKWTNKATNYFVELHPIGRCHNYEIHRKYTYLCKKCGYRYNRSRQLKNAERKRCGIRNNGICCYGPFQLIINSNKIKKSPSQLNKFALFVKEKYKIVQQEHKDLKHKELMKILSARYRQGDGDSITKID